MDQNSLLISFIYVRMYLPLEKVKNKFYKFLKYISDNLIKLKVQYTEFVSSLRPKVSCDILSSFEWQFVVL